MFSQLGFGLARSMAWLSILLDANMGPMSSKGTMTCHGNLVAANARLKQAGKAIAASQRIVFHFKRLFLSEFFIVVSLLWQWSG